MTHEENTTFQSYSSVWTYDPRTRIFRRALRTRNDRDLHGVAVRRGYLWAGTIPSGRTEIVKIQPVMREILWRTPLGIKGSAPQQAALPGNVILLALGQDAVWIAIDHPNSVWRLDTRTGKVLATIKLGFSPAAIAVSETGVWITDPLSDSVVRIDPNTDHVAETFRVGRTPEHLAVGAGSVWTANTRDGTVSRIDPKTFDMKTVDVGGTPEDLAVGLGGTWVVVQPR
jgi:YVTN family beta-propeller protein